MKLSIIVPIYNVEQYILECVQSVYRQALTENDFELILVNDGTQDNSFGVIKDIIHQHTNIIVVEQSNQGLSAARNTGLLYAKGDYILFLDSDDLLIDNTIPSLLALSEKMPDLIVAGFKKMNNDEIHNFMAPSQDRIIVEEKSGEELFLRDLNPQQCYVWRTLYKKEFLDNNNLKFIRDIFFEDVPFTTECYLKARRCVKTSQIFYIYRQRVDSIVSTLNIKKIFDFNTVLARLWEMKRLSDLSAEQEAKLMDILFVTFSISIWYVSHDNVLLKQRKDIVRDLENKIPDISFTNGLKQKIISCFYRIAPCTYIYIRGFFSTGCFII